MFFFQITGVPAFFSSDFRSTSSNFSCRAFRGSWLRPSFMDSVKQLLGRVHGFAER
jgi:hypothetical protein